MKVATKLVVVLLFGITALLVVDSYMLIEREMDRFEVQLRRHASELGHMFRELIADVWAIHGQERALKRIEQANDEGHLARIRWVWIDAEPGEPHGPVLHDHRLDNLDRQSVLSLKGTDASGLKRLYTYILVPLKGERPGALEISQSLSRPDAWTTATIHRMLFLTGTVVATCAVLAAVLGVALIGRPLKRLAEKASRVGQGDLTGPLRLRGRDELSQLATAFNRMCESLAEAQERARTETKARISALEQLRHEDRLRTVGRLASGIAHELGTPLNVISGRAGLIASGQMEAEQNVESAAIIRAQAERMTKIIQQLLDFARRRSPHKRAVDLLGLARQTIEVLAPLSNRRRVSISVSETDDARTVQADPGQIQQVLVNLLVNAFDASVDGGTIEIGVGHESTRPPEGHDGPVGKYLCLYVQDVGEGISEDNIAHIFEPFFTTKDVGVGTGLGLSIAYGIIREHGGWIAVESQPGSGTRFSVYLPQENGVCAETS